MLFNHRTLHVDLDQPRLVGGVPTHGRGWNEIYFKVPSTPTIPQFFGRVAVKEMHCNYFPSQRFTDFSN